jgi:hypothetical protein
VLTKPVVARPVVETASQRQARMPRKLDPITPAEILLEEFMRPLAVSSE